MEGRGNSPRLQTSIAFICSQLLCHSDHYTTLFTKLVLYKSSINCLVLIPIKLISLRELKKGKPKNLVSREEIIHSFGFLVLINSKEDTGANEAALGKEALTPLPRYCKGPAGRFVSASYLSNLRANI